MAAWDICAALVMVLQIADQVHSDAILEVHVLTYSNPSGNDWHHDRCDNQILFDRSPCDHKLTFCFDESSPNGDPDHCAYKKGKTGEFKNENYISFNDNMMSVANPIKLTIPNWPGAIRFKVEIVDDDSFNGDDLVDRMNTVWTLTPARSVDQARWSRRTITGLRDRDATSLTVRLRMYCSRNFFNSRCSQYCEASDGPRHYTCDSATGDTICRTGWEGSLCDIRSDDCIGHECTNGATCRDGDHRYTCECLDGYTGRHCETDIDDCAPIPCLHGGRCVDRVAGYRCVCPTEYVGDTCSHHVCDSDQSPCRNGGTCYVRDGRASCACPSAFSGDECQRDKCLDLTCQNQGTCDGGECRCVSGYSGLYCHQQTDECDSNPCQHNGTCNDHVNGFTCDCLPGNNGPLCQHFISTSTGPDARTHENDTSGTTGRDATTPTNASTTGRDVTHPTKAPIGHHTKATTALGSAESNGKPEDTSDSHLGSLVAVIAILVVLLILVILVLIWLVPRCRNTQYFDNNGGAHNIDNPIYNSGTLTTFIQYITRNRNDNVRNTQDFDNNGGAHNIDNPIYNSGTLTTFIQYLKRNRNDNVRSPSIETHIRMSVNAVDATHGHNHDTTSRT